MPLLNLNVPNDNNNTTLLAFSLCRLLPLLEHEEFEAVVEVLFGRCSLKTKFALMQELNAYRQGSLPQVLNNLINEKLRPRLVEYIRTHPFAYYHSLLDSEEATLIALQEGNSPYSELELDVVSQLTCTHIQVYGDLRATTLLAEWIPETIQGSIPGTIHLSCISHIYQGFIDPGLLPSWLSAQLFPFGVRAMMDESKGTSSQIALKRAELHRDLRETLQQIPSRLAALSHPDNVPRKPIIEDPFSFPRPSNLKAALRADTVRESRVACSELEEVHLDTSYDLCSMSDSDGSIDKRRLYVVIDNEARAFNYTMRDLSDGIIASRITFDDIKEKLPDTVDFPEPINLDQLRLFLPTILQITTERRHTQVELAEIGDFTSRIGSWSMGTGISTGGGLALVGFITVAEELGIGAGAGFAAMASIGIPVTVASLTFGLIISIFGKEYAITYEKALREASNLISQGRYAEAARALDEEFNRSWITRSSRYPFLTKQHHAIGHFFRGICAEFAAEAGKAYSHYRSAAEDTRQDHKKLAFFVAQLQCLKILKTADAVQLPPGLNREQAIEDILLSLRGHYEDGFADLYWLLHERMTQMTRRIVPILEHLRYVSSQSMGELGTINEEYRLQPDEIQSANAFLVADSFFVLKHFSKGFGAFIDVFANFFQGALLTFFAHTDPGSLYLQTKNKLCKKFNIPQSINEKNLIFLMASQQLLHSMRLLALFKRDYKIIEGEQNLREEKQISAKQEQIIKDSILLMETFIINFHVLFSDEQDIRAIPELNSHSEKDRLHTENSARLEFMTKLQADFQLTHETLEDWLDELGRINTPLVNVFSQTTGDSMLHALATLPEIAGKKSQVQQVARQLKHLCYQRNNAHATPMMALIHHDPYELRDVIYSEPMSDELKRLEEFLKAVEANPQRSDHFILLDGPPGAGKTWAVKKYLFKLGYSIDEWTQGCKDDGVVNGLTTRIINFFQVAKAKARNTRQLQLLFIDEIHGVIPIVRGAAQNGYHNTEQDVNTFLTQITDLQNHQVILIGATNYPERLPKAMLDRAGSNRIYFPLPNATHLGNEGTS